LPQQTQRQTNDRGKRAPRRAGVPGVDVAGADAMASSSPPAGGALIAAGAILGTIVGVVSAQPTLGFLVGSGIGILAALLIWWRSR
jgi:hypothetical protein